MVKFRFQDLKIWQLAIEIADALFDISDELEKKLRLKALETFGGRKGDLSRAVEEAVKTWVATDK